MSASVLFSFADDEAGDKAHSLAAWLRDDGYRSTFVRRRGEPDYMSTVIDAVEVLIQPDGVMVALIAAATTWLSSRRRPTKLLVTLEGQTVEVDLPPGSDPAAVAASVTERLGRGPSAR